MTSPSCTPPGSNVPCPSVIRLVHFVRVPYRSRVPLSRRAVFARDEHRCQYCNRPAENIDHVIPRSRGRRAHLGERRGVVPALQRPQGEPVPPRDRPAPAPAARRAPLLLGRDERRPHRPGLAALPRDRRSSPDRRRVRLSAAPLGWPERDRLGTLRRGSPPLRSGSGSGPAASGATRDLQRADAPPPADPAASGVARG